MVKPIFGLVNFHIRAGFRPKKDPAPSPERGLAESSRSKMMLLLNQEDGRSEPPEQDISRFDFETVQTV
jgi:hypothetical protein